MPGWHRSIFVKLLTIMAAVMVSVLLAVAIVGFTLFPSMTESRHLVSEYARVLAATAPDHATAARLAARHHFQIAYEGPGGAWTTVPGVSSIAELRRAARWHDVYLAPGGKGGTYLVVWEIARGMNEAHARMVRLLLLLVAAIITAAYFVLRRSLRPVRALYEGVTRLSEGHLDVVVENRSRDELGALTGAFNRMVRRIADMLSARDQLLLDVSHELRSPLTRIKVALALLPEDDKSRRIAADVIEMEAMLTELLELERLRDGRGIKAGRRDLLPILREIVESFADRTPGARLVPAADPPREILVEIDGDRLRTVLRNLVENAIKYSLPDSTAVEVSAEQKDRATVVRIVDDGPGIPEADLPNLFEPFFRVDRSRSKKSGGYGLGLSICKRIMEAHGGTIEVENRAGRRGACFTLTLPG